MLKLPRIITLLYRKVVTFFKRLLSLRGVKNNIGKFHAVSWPRRTDEDDEYIHNDGTRHSSTLNKDTNKHDGLYDDWISAARAVFRQQF